MLNDVVVLADEEEVELAVLVVLGAEVMVELEPVVVLVEEVVGPEEPVVLVEELIVELVILVDVGAVELVTVTVPVDDSV